MNILFKFLRVFATVMMCTLSAHAFAAKNQYTVLAYHDVIEEKVAPKIDNKYLPQTIRVETLINHFNWLKINGYVPVRFQDVLDARAGKKDLPAKAILLTFDDGYEGFYRVVFPLLKLYNYPAVLAVVGRWIDAPEGSTVAYGDTFLPRSTFLTWPQIKALHDSGLVEIASHSYDLHHAELANSEKSLQPAALTPIWRDGIFETPLQYKNRVQKDLQYSADQIKKNIGQAPRIVVWPYGRFSDFTSDIAQQAGMPDQFTLQDDGLNDIESTHIKRLLIEEETDYSVIEAFLKGESWQRNIQRVVHVDLDYVYDKNPVQQAKNIDRLIERMKTFGISTVYLQAFADEDGNGVAEALYFHNRHLPVRADLFSRVAWQLMTRAGVKVYAWMPVMAFDLGPDYNYVTDVRTDRINPEHYKRLSPYVQNNRQTIKEIYEDLGLYTKFNGVLFHDDAFLDDFEGISKDDAPRDDGSNAARVRQNALSKSQYLIDFTQELKQAAAHYQVGGAQNIKTARNIYASAIMDEQAQDWFAQNLKQFTDAYDYTAVMAMPYMEKAANAEQWLIDLSRKITSQGLSDKVVFELQSQDWNHQKPIANEKLVQWMRILQNHGIQNYGYYPDDFLNDQPKAQTIHPVFSLSYQGMIKP